MTSSPVSARIDGARRSSAPPPAPAELARSNGETTPLTLSPATCCVCGDEPSEPTAVTEDFDFRTSPDTFLMQQCAGCGSVYLSLVPSEQSAAQTYPAAYRPPHTVRWGSAIEAGARTFEPGLPVRSGRLQDAAREREQYDHAILALTLEHAPDPAEVLAAVHAMLRPGARAVVVLHNLKSPAFALFKGRHWGGYDVPRQRRILSAEALGRLAARAGLEVVGLSTVAAADPWTRSLRRLCQDWHGPTWLANRFGDGALASTAFFGALDFLLRPLGRGALLVATLRRPEREPLP